MKPFFSPRSNSLKNRLILGLGVVLTLMLGVIILAVLQLQAMSRVAQHFVDDDMQRLLQVQALTLHTEGAGNALLVLLNSPRAQRVLEYAAVDERNRRIEAISRSLSEHMTEPNQVQELAFFNQAHQNYLDAFIHTVEQIEFGNQPAALASYSERVRPAISKMTQVAGQFMDRERSRIVDVIDDNQRRLQALHLVFVAAAALALIVAVIVARRVTRQVVGPLRRMVTEAQRIGAGDFFNGIPETRIREMDLMGSAINTMAGQIAARETQILDLAFNDPLTGLRNRTYLTRPTSDGHDCSTLMLMDLARLKSINETLGFEMGDEVIQHMAGRFAQTIKELELAGHFTTKPVLARLSGGTLAASFVVDDRATANQVRHRVEAAMAEPVRCDSYSVDLSVAFGLADCEGAQKAMPVLQLLRNAEVALQAAKRQALPAAWFNQAQEAARLGHLGLLSDLKEAIAQSQLQMWLQPKWELSSMQPVGFEALVRWIHPEKGAVSPAEFVPFAERTGAIRMVTRWMLRQAVEQLKAWRLSHPSWSIAVNLSTRDVQDLELINELHALIGHDPDLTDLAPVSCSS